MKVKTDLRAGRRDMSGMAGMSGAAKPAAAVGGASRPTGGTPGAATPAGGAGGMAGAPKPTAV